MIEDTCVHDTTVQVIGLDSDIAFNLQDFLECDRWWFFRCIPTFQPMSIDARKIIVKTQYVNGVQSTYSRRNSPVMYCSTKFLVGALPEGPGRPGTSFRELVI